MRILVTNDDGIDSVGLHVLARRLTEEADVVVVAPDTEYSGSGASLGTLEMMQPEVHRAAIDGIDEVWTVTGPPALCVYFARLGAFGDFDLVVSGINPGANVGRAVYHSGTVGATLTGRNAGWSGIAISQDALFEVEGQGIVTAGQQWASAAEVAAAAARGLLAYLPETPALVNINVPNLPIDEIKGWRHAQIGRRAQRAVSSVELVEKPGHTGAYRLEMTWGDEVELPPETDGGTVAEGCVSVTYLSSFVHEERQDLAAVEDHVTGLFG